MATANDLSIREADLRHLKKEIEQEISQVETVLQKAVTACNEHPADNDDIMRAIEVAGKELDENWSKLIATFRDAGSELDKLIADVAKAIEKALENLKKLTQ